MSLPTAVVEEQTRLILCNEPARRKGLHEGMSLGAAYALAPDLWVKQRDHAAETAALAELAGWAGQFTSVVSLAPPQGLLLEVGGSERLFGGEQALMTLVSEGLTALNYTSGIAIAPTPLAAWLLSRMNMGTVSDEQSLAGSLARIPLEAFPLEAKVVDELLSMGLRTFADCYRLPRDGLARRVGLPVVAFLDRALGRIPDPRIPYVAPKIFERGWSLPAEVETVEALILVIRRMLLELTGLLRSVDGGIQQVEVQLFHRAHRPTGVSLALVAPTRDARHLQMLLQERLERISLPGPVEQVGIKTGEFIALAPQALDFFKTKADIDEDWSRLIEKLQARLGKPAVWGLCVNHEHRPEQAWQLTGIPQNKKVAEEKSGPGQRPLWLLSEPTALPTREDKPQIRGALQLLQPLERIESGWWDGGDVARDYFIATNKAGERFWLFRDKRSPSTWYLHGVFA